MNNRTLEDIDRLEKIEEILSELKTLAENGAIIVVEGRRDAESLKQLGIDGDIRLASHQPLLEFTEELTKSNQEIIVLTDWDKTGGIIARKIIRYLLSFGIMPNTDIRSRMRNLVKKRIKDIESLNNFMNKFRFELYGITRF